MNVFTPYLPGEEDADPATLKPVMFWLHGGGGTATDATYDGASLTSRSDVVLVSINWRGGSFGKTPISCRTDICSVKLPSYIAKIRLGRISVI